MRKAAIALVHHPVLGRQGEVLTTTLTNLDMHDLARCARTYALTASFIVHPLSAQQLLAKRILAHWVDGAGGKRIPDRAEALGLTRLVASLDEARAELGDDCEVWTTAARGEGALTGYAEARERLREAGPPVLIVFGTGWGLARSVIDAAELRLAPIDGVTNTEGEAYNHLSVRAACAITLDRLFSTTR